MYKMNGPGLFDLPTEETNRLELLDLPEELRHKIFKHIIFYDNRKYMPYEAVYHNLMNSTALVQRSKTSFF
jgi:hypothetical protein